MKPLIPVVVTLGFAFTAASAAHAQPAAKQLEPSAPRTVVVSATAAPPVVRTALLQSTLIVLPPQEKVANVFAGDTVDWVFDGGHVASRFISIKPKVAGSETDVHIISDHGNEYTLELEEVSGDGDPRFDSKIFLQPGDKAAKEKLIELPVFVPASELDQAKQEIAAAKTAETATLKTEQTKEEEYRSRYPGTLRFDFTWDKSKGDAIGLRQIWHDDKFTYLRGEFQETPALYEVKDGKPSLINFDFSNGLYTVPKELERGYLSIGKQKVEFHRTDGGN
ncbi:MAG TPA: TrbG/VirB9 family P-type conjugative transfer protein [Terracidiphilus sp.]|nr:TrbG/VirB9 family P-type conjugative transfer protein [Terracidiphilus sp.]